MANQINRDVYVLSDKVKEHIDYVRFTNALPIVFTFRDYNIPQGSVATAFCTKPSGKAVYTDATISGNAITIDVSDQMFIELGRTVIQVKIENGSSTLVTFGWPVDVHENSTEGDVPPSQNESGFWDELQQRVDDAVENCNNAVDSVNQVIQESQQATQNANNAATNANEAAQQVFDEQYILTTKHTFGLSDTVEPTSEGNALVESMEGDTWQGENPSPESPQHIYGIGDTGYFDGELQQGVYRNSDGAFTNIAYGVSGLNKINVNPGDIVKLVSNPEYIVRISLFQNNGDFIKTYVNTNPNQGFIETEPLPDSSGYVLVSVQSFDAVTPVTPQTAGHIAVTINGKYAVKVNTMSANLFDASKIPTTSAGGATVTNNGDGSFTVSGSGSLSGKFSASYGYSHAESVRLIKKSGNIIMGFEKTTYPYAYMTFTTSSGYIGEVDNRQAGTKIFSITDEMLEDENFSIHIGFNGNQGGAISGETIKPIVYQDGDGTFVPFQDETAYLPISYPLYKGDQIVKIGSEYKVRRVNGVAVFDGSADEGWLYSESYNQIFTDSAKYNIKNESLNPGIIRCDKFISGSTTERNSGKKEIIYQGAGGKGFIGIASLLFTSSGAATAWLQSNPITVVYKLSAPVYEDIDQDQFYSIMAADELTNISLLGENENLFPTNVIRFPRNEDGALSTTAYAIGMTNQIAEEPTAPGSVEDRLAALETQMAALNSQTIIVE